MEKIIELMLQENIELLKKKDYENCLYTPHSFEKVMDLINKEKSYKIDNICNHIYCVARGIFVMYWVSYLILHFTK